MEILKVSMDEVSKLITITFHPTEILEAKKFFKELFSDDNEECGACSCNPCMCGTDQQYQEPYVDEPIDYTGSPEDHMAYDKPKLDEGSIDGALV